MIQFLLHVVRILYTDFLAGKIFILVVEFMHGFIFVAMTTQQNKLTLLICGRKYFTSWNFGVDGNRQKFFSIWKFPNLRYGQTSTTHYSNVNSTCTLYGFHIPTLCWTDKCSTAMILFNSPIKCYSPYTFFTYTDGNLNDLKINTAKADTGVNRNKGEGEEVFITCRGRTRRKDKRATTSW